MNRVLVVGTSGSGKTVFARQLAKVHGLKHIELDALHWLPNWTERPDEQFRSLTQTAIETERWVADGNYHQVADLLWARADTVVWLNYSFGMVFRRIVARTLRRVVTREALFSGNRESVRQSFCSRDSIIWWMLTSFHRRRRQYRQWFDNGAFAHLDRVELKNSREADDFLRRLGTSRSEAALDP